jgi:hypothetical protein
VSEARRGEVADVTGRVIVGDPFIDLVHAIYAHEADLVLVGSRRRGTLQRLLTGNTVEYLVRHAPVPVLVVRADQDWHRGTREPVRQFVTEERTRAKPGGNGWRRPVLQLLRSAVEKV